MTQQEFISKSTKWINNKIILSHRSNWYKIPFRMAALQKVKQVFAAHLTQQCKYSAGQIAILLKRNESVLESILPIPSNPSYENSVRLLKELLIEAERIINTYNLSI